MGNSSGRASTAGAVAEMDTEGTCARLVLGVTSQA